MNAKLIGARVERNEDYRFLTGAAAVNAITDALGVKDIPMPATAQTVWRSMQRTA